MEKVMELRTEDDEKETDPHNTIPEFIKNEIQDAIDRLKKGKRKTAMEYKLNNSKIAVMIRRKKFRTIFNEIALQDDFTPKSWRKIRIQVIYKKGW